MSKAPINPQKIIVFTGAGISAESGLKTFRDSNGLWENHPVELVASVSGWRNNPELVLDFYNQRRVDAANAEPNKAHLAIAELENKFDIVVITQNVDDLHERAGSSNVIHLHGSLNQARSSINSNLIYDIGSSPILLGQTCALQSQLRPNIVFFGEIPHFLDEAKSHIIEAACVMAIGSSLVVEPAASLLKKARFQARKILITLDVDKIPFGFKLQRGKATELVPYFCNRWLSAGKFS
ncbi:MAG TPA: Sir2 family NAD-dependent protein deacetylase [Cellvibrio sp.]|nr:Sir2 family NAD-dependent protein deacetylase [Cellvibrio sp.]